MDVLIKINNQTVGRDRIARLLQYLSRLLWHRLQKNNKNGVNGLKDLEYQLSSFRKLLRFGRFAESLYAALKLMHHEDPTVRYTIVLSKICNSVFLLIDHLLWLGRSDLYEVNVEKWGRTCNRYWLYSITLNLVRDFYEISLILKAQKPNLMPQDGLKNANDLWTVLTRAFNLVQNNNSVMIDTVKNSCDFFIPLTALGHIKLSPGTVGFLGVVSSIAGLLVLIDPTKKLSPS